MEWQLFKKLIKSNLERLPKEKYLNANYNLNHFLDKNLFTNIGNEVGFDCNVEDREFLKIDFTLTKRTNSYSVPQVFIEIENNIYAEEENGHEVCKLAATSAPLKVFITRYFGDWKIDRNKKLDMFDSSLIDRFSSMLAAYDEIQKESFNPNQNIIIVEINNEQGVTFYTEIWNSKEKCFELEPRFLFQCKLN